MARTTASTPRAQWNDAAATRLQGAANVVLGAALLARGHRWWAASTGRDPTAIESSALVVLAIRELAEGLAQLTAPTLLRRIWLVVDLAHAASMVLVAALRPQLRRPAMVSAGVAAGSAALSVVAMGGRPCRV